MLRMNASLACNPGGLQRQRTRYELNSVRGAMRDLLHRLPDTIDSLRIASVYSMTAFTLRPHIYNKPLHIPRHFEIVD